ncbi:MAG TPA: iron ABC transporter permease [Chitinophagaceae bacterium]|nr:iron ABC transporter permease [Chitinophagaceae bacterium]
MLRNKSYFFGLLAFLLFIVMIAAIAFGAVPVTPRQMLSAFAHFFKGEEPASIYEAVFLQLRLPRVLLCAITGAILAVSGVLMQGLFRNPIVEPGLVGTSAGAALGASIVFVWASAFNSTVKAVLGPLLMPLMAFLGAWAATYLVYVLSGRGKRISVLSLLLTGIAVNAICLSGTGFLSYIARDPQARSITFWNLGSFSGASWWQVATLGVLAAVAFLIAGRYAKQLNALLLGEDEAAYLGVDPRRLRKRVLLLNTAMVSVATAFTGVISFVGLVVPHVLRLLIGSDNKRLLPAAMLSGALLLTLADACARWLLAPAELPVGIITSVLGAPVFIVLLKKFNVLQEKGGGHD